MARIRISEVVQLVPPTVPVTVPGNKLVGLNMGDVYPQGLSQTQTIRVYPVNAPGVSVAPGFEAPVTVDPSTGIGTALVMDTSGGVHSLEVPSIGALTVSAGSSPLLPFDFYIDPQRVTPQFKKNATPTLTRGGYEVQHWGDALTGLQVEAVTGSLLVANRAAKTSLPLGTPITGGAAYQALKNLRKIYFNDHANRPDVQQSLLGLQYYDMFCIGYFSDFTGPVAVSEKPFLMSFSFNFTVQQVVET